ncbi:hypothetical protein CRUP_017928, partial [Coryphaenoides rupestris]
MISRLDHHPLPEEVDDVHTPQHYLHDLQEAVSTHNSSQTSAASRQSDCPTVVTGDINQSWSDIHSYTGTGISTERSSEFDNAASRQVQQMFEEIDRELILGTQLVCPSDEGFQWYATSGRATTSSSQPAAEKDSVTRAQDKDRPATELNVQGRRAVLVKPPQAEEPDGPPRDAPGGPPGHDGARVIMAEGLMEEYLAFDSRDLREALLTTPLARDTGAGSRRAWSGTAGALPAHRSRAVPLPPASRVDLLFDDVWRQLVAWMGELVQRHWEGCVSGGGGMPRKKPESPVAGKDTQGSLQCLPAAPLPCHAACPRLDQTRVAPAHSPVLQQSP